MNRTIKNFLIPIFIIITVGLYGQDDCPDDLNMLHAPGEGEPGCIDYTDCNDNGAFDVGEPCFDAPPEGDYGDTGDYDGEEGGDPVSEAFFNALDSGADPTAAFDAAAGVVYQLEVVEGDLPEDEYQEGLDAVSQAFNQALDDGADPGEAWGAAMAAADQMEEGDDYDGNDDSSENGEEYGDHTVENCIALAENRDIYMVDGVEYAVWDEADVDCGFLLEEIGYEPPPTDDGGDGDHDWYCAICDEHFATEAEMDQHAAEMGHTMGGPDGGCDPEGDYPENPPGEDEGCIAYEDCNGNGAFDIGEPCHDGPPPGDGEGY